MPRRKPAPLTQNGDGSKLMRIKELAESTGLPKSTIAHYVHQGLLPKPIKTARNMAYYHPSCVERIAFLRQIQSQYRLPLAAIKRLLKERDKGRDVTPLLEFQKVLFRNTRRTLTLNKFSKATGLSAEEANSYVEMQLLIPLGNGLFDEEDIEIGRVLKRLCELGVDLEEASFYPRICKQLLEHELEWRRRLTAELPFEQDASLTLELTRAARALRPYVIDRLFQRRLLAMKGLKDADD